MTFTKEWLQQTIAAMESQRDEAPFGISDDHDMTIEALKMALAGMEAEPVAWRVIGGSIANGRVYTSNEAVRDDWIRKGMQVGPVYSAPQPLTTSERAELENYRNAQQVVPAQDDADPRDEFEKVFPIPAHVSRCGKGYAVHEYNAWSSHDYVKKWDGWNACRAAMLQGKAEPRDSVRRDHAEWSQSIFGNVGPVGPLKHLSKEALEAAAEPGDLSEWADMQFLLWDAQRRAGITDDQITKAMIEKLAVNKTRLWPEPKDGEPRLHIKAAPQQEVKP